MRTPLSYRFCSLDDIFNAIAAATAVYQDSLALLISIYNRTSISMCRNGEIARHILWRAKSHGYIISLFSIGLTNVKIIPVL